jgi:hypothetical protein
MEAAQYPANADMISTTSAVTVTVHLIRLLKNSSISGYEFSLNDVSLPRWSLAHEPVEE